MQNYFLLFMIHALFIANKEYNLNEFRYNRVTEIVEYLEKVCPIESSISQYLKNKIFFNSMALVDII